MTVTQLFGHDTSNVNEANFESALAAVGEGPFFGVDEECEVLWTSGMGVAVQTGTFLVGGVFARISADEAITLPNGDVSNPRIDRIIARRDNATNLVTVVRLAGTPAGSPVAPALTRAGGVWEISLAQILVATAATNIAQADITDERHDYGVCGWANDRRGIARLRNSSGGTRNVGDVVVINTGTNNSYTTTTTPGSPAIIGVVAETTANAAFGRVYLAGVVPIVVETGTMGSVVIGDYLRCAAVAGRVERNPVFGAPGTVARALTGVGTNGGRVLAELKPPLERGHYLYDDCLRADSSDLNANGGARSGHRWTEAAGDWQISSNHLRLVSTASAHAILDTLRDLNSGNAYRMRGSFNTGPSAAIRFDLNPKFSTSATRIFIVVNAATFELWVAILGVATMVESKACTVINNTTGYQVEAIVNGAWITASLYEPNTGAVRRLNNRHAQFVDPQFNGLRMLGVSLYTAEAGHGWVGLSVDFP